MRERSNLLAELFLVVGIERPTMHQSRLDYSGKRSRALEEAFVVSLPKVHKLPKPSRLQEKERKTPRVIWLQRRHKRKKKQRRVVRAEGRNPRFRNVCSLSWGVRYPASLSVVVVTVRDRGNRNSVTDAVRSQDYQRPQALEAASLLDIRNEMTGLMRESAARDGNVE